MDVDVVVGGAPGEYQRSCQHGVRLIDASSAAVTLRRADRVLHCMGNSQFHRHVYELLLRYGGAVMLHDVQLSGFYGWYAGVERPQDPLGRLVERVERQYGARIPPQELRTAPLSLERRVALGIYLTAEVQQHAERLFVHSRFARNLVAGDSQTVARRPPVSVMPFGMPAPLRETPPTPPAKPPLVVHMGVVSEVKGVAVLIQAFARLAADHPGARLVIAGPGDASDQTGGVRRRARTERRGRVPRPPRARPLRGAPVQRGSRGSTTHRLERRGLRRHLRLPRGRRSDDRDRSRLDRRAAAQRRRPHPRPEPRQNASPR